MFLCTSEFDIEEEQASLLREYFSRDEIEAEKEEKEDPANLIDFDPISDTEEQGRQGEEEEEEEEDGEDDEQEGEEEVRIEQHEDHFESELPLPQSDTQRRKRVRRDDDYEYY